MKLKALLLTLIILLATLTLACGPGGEWIEWQQDVLENQREGLPAEEVSP